MYLGKFDWAKCLGYTEDRNYIRHEDPPQRGVRPQGGGQNRPGDRGHDDGHWSGSLRSCARRSTGSTAAAFN